MRNATLGVTVFLINAAGSSVFAKARFMPKNELIQTAEIIAVDRDLARRVKLLHVSPFERRNFRNPKATSVQCQQDAFVARVVLQSNHPKHFCFIRDALSQLVWK